MNDLAVVKMQDQFLGNCSRLVFSESEKSKEWRATIEAWINYDQYSIEDTLKHQEKGWISLSRKATNLSFAAKCVLVGSIVTFAAAFFLKISTLYLAGAGALLLAGVIKRRAMVALDQLREQGKLLIHSAVMAVRSEIKFLAKYYPLGYQAWAHDRIQEVSKELQKIALLPGEEEGKQESEEFPAAVPNVMDARIQNTILERTWKVLLLSKDKNERAKAQYSLSTLYRYSSLPGSESYKEFGKQLLQAAAKAGHPKAKEEYLSGAI